MKKISGFYLIMILLGLLFIAAGVFIPETMPPVMKLAALSSGFALFIYGTQRLYQKNPVKFRNPNFAKREKTEEADERNQQIRLITAAKMYEVVLGFEVILAMILLMDNAIEKLYSYMMIGFIVAQGILSVILNCYYEKRH